MLEVRPHGRQGHIHLGRDLLIAQARADALAPVAGVSDNGRVTQIFDSIIDAVGNTPMVRLKTIGRRNSSVPRADSCTSQRSSGLDSGSCGCAGGSMRTPLRRS